MITGKHVRIRAIEENDLPTLTNWRNDPEVYKNFFEYQPLSLLMERRWFERFLDRGDEKFWIVETIEASKPVGTVGLVNVNWRSREAELARVLVAPECQGQGYGKEICGLALQYTFNHMNLNRIHLKVFADNTRAISIYKSLGFIEEGLLREHVFADGRYCNVLILGILHEEYLAASRQIQDSSVRSDSSNSEIK